MTDPIQFEQLTDREWSQRASRQSGECLAVVSQLRDDWNKIVTDNRMLLSRQTRMDKEITDLRDTVEMLTSIILDGAK